MPIDASIIGLLAYRNLSALTQASGCVKEKRKKDGRQGREIRRRVNFYYIGTIKSRSDDGLGLRIQKTRRRKRRVFPEQLSYTLFGVVQSQHLFGHRVAYGAGEQVEYCLADKGLCCQQYDMASWNGYCERSYQFVLVAGEL